MGAEQWLWIDPVALADIYLEGRSRRTFLTYDLAFCKLWVNSVEIGKFVFIWNEIDIKFYKIYCIYIVPN